MLVKKGPYEEKKHCVIAFLWLINDFSYCSKLDKKSAYVL